MKTLLSLLLTAAMAVVFTSCEMPPANSANTGNANANAAKTAAAAPTKEALFEMDKKANEAFLKGDGKHFEGMLSDKFVSYDRGMRMDKAAVVKMIGETKCDVKSWSIDDPQMSKINDDTYVITYKGTFDGMCGDMKIPSPTRASSIWVRNGDKWMGAYHGENLIVDPKNPPKAPPAPTAKPAEKKDGKAEPTSDPSTDAMMAVEKSVWEAWKDKDAKKLEELTAKDLSFVNIFGSHYANKADTIKDWSGGNCEVQSVSLTEGVGTSLSPTVGILTLKGTANGTCDGQKIPAVWGTSVYVKEGDAWKLAFTFNSPAS